MPDAECQMPNAKCQVLNAKRQLTCALLFIIGHLAFSIDSVGAQEPPALTAPVNDFANVVVAASEREMERRIRDLQKATGDTVVVATVRTFQPYADIDMFAVKMFAVVMLAVVALRVVVLTCVAVSVPVKFDGPLTDRAIPPEVFVA